MELPNILRIELDKIAEGNKLSRLKETSDSLTDRYKNDGGKGKRLVTTEIDAITYALVRMPATYGAVYSALKYTLENFSGHIESVLDIGAGTGACFWAISELIDNKVNINCLEREEAMIKVGKKLSINNPLYNNTSWIKKDFVSENIVGHYDLVIASYSLNELSEMDRTKVVKKLLEVTNKLLVVVEPGTPLVFNQLRQIRTMLIGDNNMYVIAPCPHNCECKISQDDWCHFTCRVPRSKLHRLLKGAEAPYEDEKFSYLAVSKENPHQSIARIIRHPLIEPGRITLKMCTEDGIITKVYTKKDGKFFKFARKVNCGDSFNI